MEEVYRELIETLSDAYNARGYARFVEQKPQIKEAIVNNGRIPSEVFEFVYSVVVKYLDKKNSNANTRIMGGLWPDQVNTLVEKCREQSRGFITSDLRKASRDSPWDIHEILFPGKNEEN